MSSPEKYREYFRAFIESTDEKAVLREELLESIEKFRTSSILEIGPGPGDISKALASSVETYLAVEMNQEYAEALQSEGLNVVHGTFPETDIEGSFDLVLAVHVIAYDENTEEIVKRAWEHLNDGGHLVLVTYREMDSDWTRLMRSSGYEQIGSIHTYTFEKLERLIAKLSHNSPEITTVQTHVNTATPMQMIDALAFVASNGNAERVEEFRERSPKIIPLIEEGYKTEGGYSFPFTHHILVAQKTKDK